MKISGFHIIASLLMILMFLFPCRIYATRYIYIIDKSGSMKDHKAKVVNAITHDFESAVSGEDSLFKDGDVIHLWYFDVDVHEILTRKFTADNAQDIYRQFSNKLQNLKAYKDTDIQKPLYKAFHEYRQSKDEIAILLYTDGQDTVSKKTFDEILRLFNKYYKHEQRLSGIYMVHFGSANVDNRVRDTIEGLGGRITKADEAGEKNISGSALTEETRNIRVEIVPKSLQVERVNSPEIVIHAPFKVSITPQGKNVRLDFSLETATGSWDLTPDYIIIDKDADYTFSFTAKGLPLGTHNASLKVTSIVKVNPIEIPLTLTTVSPKPDVVEMNFTPPSINKLNLSASAQWQDIPQLLLQTSFDNKNANVLISLQMTIPEGIELQCLAYDDPEKIFPAAEPVKISEIGNLVRFRVRQKPNRVEEKEATIILSARLEPDQLGVTAKGHQSIEIPMKFSLPVQVNCLTDRLDMGSVPRGKDKVKKVLELQVSGDPDGAKLRVNKSGQGLAALTVMPNEISLKPGKMSVDLGFSAFDDLNPGSFSGTLELVSSQPSDQLTINNGKIRVTGFIPHPAKIVPKIENPMIAGRHMRILASLEPEQKAELTVHVTKPDTFIFATKEIQLFDDGSATHGDKKANDKVYSNFFTDTDHLGGYEFRFSGVGPANGVQEEFINEPVLFDFPDETLEKKGIVISSLEGPFGIEIEVTSDVLDPILIECIDKKIDSNGKTITSIRLKDSSITQGKQLLTLEFRPESSDLSGCYEFEVPLKIGPVQNRTIEYSLPVTLCFRSEILNTFITILKIIAVIITLLAIWIFIVVPLAWKKRLRNVQSTNVDAGGQYTVLSAACRKNRWKSMYKIFALIPRASFGGGRKSDILVPERTSVDGYLYPKTARGKITVKARNELRFTDGVSMTAGNSRTVTKDDGNHVLIDSEKLKIFS